MKLKWIIDSCRQFNSCSVYYKLLKDSAGPERAGSEEKMCVSLFIDHNLQEGVWICKEKK